MLDYTQTRLRLYTRAFIWHGSMQITTRGRSVYELEWTLAPRGVNGFAWRLTTATSFACIVCRHYRKSSVSPRVQVWLSIVKVRAAEWKWTRDLCLLHFLLNVPQFTIVSIEPRFQSRASSTNTFTLSVCSRFGRFSIFLSFVLISLRFLSILTLGIKSQWSNPT